MCQSAAKPATTTVTTSISTTTITVTASTVTQYADPQPTFVLQLSGSNTVYNGVPLDGTYDNLDTGDGPLVGFNGDTSISNTLMLTFNVAGNLVILQDPNSGYLAYISTPHRGANLVLFGQTISPGSDFMVTCLIVGIYYYKRSVDWSHGGIWLCFGNIECC